MSLANRAIRLMICGLMPAALAMAAPGDELVEAYLRQSQMDQLLEVQLESRLEHADSDDERDEVIRSLSALYLRQLRSVGQADPYREVVLTRADWLIQIADDVPLYELRLEVLVNAFVSNENAIELHQLGLLDSAQRQAAADAMGEAHDGLTRLLTETMPDEERLVRRRTSARTLDAEREVSDQIEVLRRMNSFGNYYLGWSGYGLAVLEDQYVENDTFEAFGWLLSAEGRMPQSKDLHLAAVEYDHVARSAIGVAMCYAQTEEYQFATTWLNGLLEQDDISPDVRNATELRLLRIHVLSESWNEALIQATRTRNQLDPDVLPVADARYVILKTLESKRHTDDSDAEKLVQTCIEDLVEQREIGHIVELYRRFDRIPMLGNGFIPNYARALAELEQGEEDGDPNYLNIADVLVRALRAKDADEYPEHRDDCRLKLAYTYVRADRPDQAIEQCQLVLDTSVDQQALEEARWIRIAALDHANALAGESSSTELEEAIRAFIDAHPSSDRTRTLVLRYAMRGVIDEQLAMDTLRAVPLDDPDAVAARHLQVQLQYRLLRRGGFTDLSLLRETRETISWLLEREQQGAGSSPEVLLSSLQIGIDLALRAQPSDPDEARRLIERARGLVDGQEGLQRVEPELISQLIRTELVQSRLDAALALLDELRVIDEQRAEEARVLILNAVVEKWRADPSGDSAQDVIDIAVPVLARITPKPPEPIGVQQSAMIEVVAHAAGFLHSQEQDDEMRALSLRLSKQVLERGHPSEPGLRRTAAIAGESVDTQTAMEAWLRLLAAYPQDDERWYEARYESLVAMNRIDPERAKATYAQFRTLNPTLGPSPWRERFVALFGTQGPERSDGGAP